MRFVDPDAIGEREARTQGDPDRSVLSGQPRTQHHAAERGRATQDHSEATSWFDFDALSVWFGFERTTSAMPNRGEYGVGVPRLLELLGRHAIRATLFFTRSARSWVSSAPTRAARISAAAHARGADHSL
jgi:hypothetical protein